jgi:hypothetical protein
VETDRLIESLAEGLKPAPPRQVPRRIATAAMVGAPLALIVVATLLGFRPDLAVAVLGMTFWMKSGYALSLAVAGFWCAERLARPAGSARGGAWLAASALAVLVAIGLADLMMAAPQDRLAMWLGKSWRTCPRNILLLAAPTLALALLAVRSLAPTRLVQAGAAAGLFAGGVATLVYCLHCPETGPAFVATWYTLGVALSAAAGAALGPFVLRWR